MVHRHGCSGVAQHALNDLRISTMGQPDRGDRVPKIMDSKVLECRSHLVHRSNSLIVSSGTREAVRLPKPGRARRRLADPMPQRSTIGTRSGTSGTVLARLFLRLSMCTTRRRARERGRRMVPCTRSPASAARQRYVPDFPDACAPRLVRMAAAGFAVTRPSATACARIERSVASARVAVAGASLLAMRVPSQPDTSPAVIDPTGHRPKRGSM